MKKALYIVLIFVMIVGAVVGGYFLYQKYYSQSKVITQEEEQKSALDLAQFQKFDKSYFGLMHPQMSYSFTQELGVHWQRPHPGPFIWGEIEKNKGSFDFEGTDEYVKKSQNYEVVIMATIWPYADWDQSVCHLKLPNSPRTDFSELGDYRGKPCDSKQYQKFLKALVERYDGDNIDDMPNLKYPIKYWEIINEPEMEGELLFFKGNNQAQDYLEVLKNTSLAIKEADDKAKILNGGIAALSEQELPFWQTVLGGEGKDYVDIVTIHSIGGSDDLNLQKLEDFMKDYKLTQPVWVTEIQFGGPPSEPNLGPKAPGPGGKEPPPSNPSPVSIILFNRALAQVQNPAPPQKKENLNQEEWSQYLVKIFVQALERKVKRLYYVGLDNLAPTETNALLLNCGNQNDKQREFNPANCEKQKAFYAYKTLVQKIDYFESVEKLADGRYKFIKNGKTIYILWGLGSLPGELVGAVKRTDIYGNTEEVEISNLKLSEIPIYLEQK